MKASLLAAALALLPGLSARAAEAAKEDGQKADPELMLLVDQFLSDKASELPGRTMNRLMSMDVKTLPPKLRARFQARRLEIKAWRNQEAAKKKGFYRRMNNGKKARCQFEEGDEETVAMLRKTGFEQISESEEQFLMQKTKCSECELTEEYTLTMYYVPPKKKKDPTMRYLFIAQSDPLMALLAAYRSGAKTGGTNFFGLGSSGGCR